MKTPCKIDWIEERFNFSAVGLCINFDAKEFTIYEKGELYRVWSYSTPEKIYLRVIDDVSERFPDYELAINSMIEQRVLVMEGHEDDPVSAVSTTYDYASINLKDEIDGSIGGNFDAPFRDFEFTCQRDEITGFMRCNNFLVIKNGVCQSAWEDPIKNVESDRWHLEEVDSFHFYDESPIRLDGDYASEDEARDAAKAKATSVGSFTNIYVVGPNGRRYRLG